MARIESKKYHELYQTLMIEENKLEQFRCEIKFISDILKNELQFRTIFQHPKPSKDEKKDMIISVFKESVSKEVLDFCYNLIDLGMEKQFIEICDEFDYIVDEKHGIIQATAYTVVPMRDNDMETLKGILAKKLKKKVVISNKVDKSIMGGVVLKVGDKIIDASVRGKLNDIHSSLNKSIIKL